MYLSNAKSLNISIIIFIYFSFSRAALLPFVFHAAEYFGQRFANIRSCRRELATKGNLGEAEGGTLYLLLSTVPNLRYIHLPKVHGCTLGKRLTLSCRQFISADFASFLNNRQCQNNNRYIHIVMYPCLQKLLYLLLLY